jgi:hypothetical protein
VSADPSPVKVYFSANFTSNLNPTKYITAVGNSNMDENLICGYFQLDVAHLENQTVYVKCLQTFIKPTDLQINLEAKSKPEAKMA